MDKRARKKKRMKNNVCVYSGKFIGNQDAVLTKYARDYLKKIGYIVSNKPILIFLMFFLMFLPFVNSTSLTDGVISYYRFEDTNGAGVNDTLGVYNATNGNATTLYKFQVGQTGKIGNCYNSTGSSFADLNQISSSGNYTFNIWLNKIGPNMSGLDTSFYDSQTGRLLLYTETTSDKVGFFDGGVTYFDYYITNGVWRMYSWVFNTNTTACFYINGVCVQCKNEYSSKNLGGTSTLGSNYLHAYTGALTGYYDEFIIYNRTLNATEINLLYNGSNGYILYSSGCSENLVNTSWSSWVNATPCSSGDDIIQNRSLLQYDSNGCNLTENLTYWDYQNISCNYCSYDIQNGTLLNWYDITECVNDTKLQNKTIVTYDFNYASCCNITGLESDCIDEITYYLQQEVYCSSPLDITEFSLDLDSKMTILIFAFIFVFVILLLYLGFFIFAGGLLIVVGFLLLFNSFNIIISILIIIGGVLILFLFKK